MRYSKRVTFIKLGTPVYDPATGDYTDGEPEETVKPADVYQTSEKLQKLIYDGIRQGAITIQLQNKYTKAFDMIRYDDRLYRVDTRKRYRTKELCFAQNTEADDMGNAIKITGDRALRQAIKKASNPRPVLQAIVRHDTAELAKNVKLETRTAFTKGYSQGDTARSTRASFEDGGLTGIVEPQTSYAAYVQYGTRFMDAEPFMTRPFMQAVADFENHIREMAE